MYGFFVRYRRNGAHREKEPLFGPERPERSEDVCGGHNGFFGSGRGYACLDEKKDSECFKGQTDHKFSDRGGYRGCGSGYKVQH